MKKLLTILVLIMLIISFYQITSMYALYREELDGDYNTLLGIWSIKVNETDITSGGQNIEFEIADDQLNYVENQYIQAGKIAPDGEAYFDIKIDPTNTDVSIIYTIDVKSDVVSNVNIELLRAENYFKLDDQVDEGTGQIIESEQITNNDVLQQGNIYTGLIPIERIVEGHKNYIRLYFKWVNVDENSETDSAIGESETPKITVPVEINLKQYTGTGDVITDDAG